jgi:NADH-quinone oxidoreductase subunit N
VTMTLGNVVAIVQQNIKRFMAFSAVSQAGYLIMGFLSSSPGVPAMIYYMLVYAVTNLSVFACIVWYANETGKEHINDYRGLSRTNPAIALAMMLGLFSLAGIPPLSGFVGKFFLFSVASKAGFHWLVAVAAINSTVSLYYYLRIVRQMYIEPADENAPRLPVTNKLAFTIAALNVAVIVLGIVPVFYQNIHIHTSVWSW